MVILAATLTLSAVEPGSAARPTSPRLTSAASVVGPVGVLSPAITGIRGSGSQAAIPGRYIVVLKGARSGRVAAQARVLTRRYGGRLGNVYERSLSGFSVAMSQVQAQRMAADPGVAYVQQDQVVHAADTVMHNTNTVVQAAATVTQAGDTQENPPSWGLDRIDQPRLPLDGSYSYDLPGLAVPPVTAYLIDSGISAGLSDFGGRASYGWDFVSNTVNATDCHGSGTHDAGIVGGAAYGVAKQVKLVALRVYDCNGNSTASGILASLDWVTRLAAKPAVVFLAIDDGCRDAAGHAVACPAGAFSAITTAIKTAIDSGLSLVIPAGNGDINACGNPFDTVAGAIVVAATSIADTEASYSDWGPCVSLYAPGGDQRNPVVSSPGILSDWTATPANGCTLTCETSNTLAAASFVTGAVAQVLARPGWSTASPAQVKDELLTHMVSTGVLSGLGTGSPNQMLYIPPPPVAGGSSIAVALNADGRLGLYGVTPDGQLLYRTQNSSGSFDWTNWIPSVYSGWYSVAAEADGGNHVIHIGLQRAPQTIWVRTQLDNRNGKWGVAHQISGLLTSVAIARSNGGLLELFGTNSAGQLWQSCKLTVLGFNLFTPWAESDLPNGAKARSVVAERNANGLVEAFALSSTGQLWHHWESSKDALQSFTPWVQLDTPAGGLSSIAVARNLDGSLQLFGANRTGGVFTRQAAAGTNNWSDWAQMLDTVGIGTVRSLAADTNADGRVELFAVDVAGQLWHRSQSGTVYTTWAQLGGAVLRP